METQPTTNVSRIAQMLMISQDEGIALWRDVQEHLREALSMYAVAEAVKACVEKRTVDFIGEQTQIKAEDIAGLIVAERFALQQAAATEKRRKEYEERRQAIEARQKKLRRLDKQSRVAVAVAKSEKKYREAVAKRANELLTGRIKAARIEADTLVAAEKSAAAEKVAAAEQALAAQVAKAAAAEKRVIAAENGLAAERAAVQKVEATNRTLENKIADVKAKLATAEKALVAEKASAAHKIATVQKAGSNSLAPEKTNSAPQPLSTRSQQAKAFPSRVAEIQQICQNRGIDNLFHFTNIVHLNSILTEGLITRSVLEHRRDRTRFRFNDSNRYDGKDKICLTVGFPAYQMFYSRSSSNQADWAVILLRPALLWELDCEFCRDNAASGRISGTSSTERKAVTAFRGMFSDQTGVRRDDLGIPDNCPTHPQAEVQVCQTVPINYIQSVYFFNVQTRNLWLRANPGEHLKQFEILSASIYFKPRMDYEYWKPKSEPLDQALPRTILPLGYQRIVPVGDDLDDPFADM